MFGKTVPIHTCVSEAGAVHSLTRAITESTGVAEVAEQLTATHVVEQHVEVALVVPMPPPSNQSIFSKESVTQRKKHSWSTQGAIQSKSQGKEIIFEVDFQTPQNRFRSLYFLAISAQELVSKWNSKLLFFPPLFLGRIALIIHPEKWILRWSTFS